MIRTTNDILSQTAYLENTSIICLSSELIETIKKAMIAYSKEVVFDLITQTNLICMYGQEAVFNYENIEKYLNQLK